MNPPPPAPAQDDRALHPAPKPQFVWDGRLQADQHAGANARLRVPTRLTMARWPGDIEAAAHMASRVVDNAARHGAPFSDDRIILRMEVMEGTRELRIYADDADPHFANFGQVAEGCEATESGLWWIARAGGRVSWYVKRDDDGPVLGKTVQVIVPAEGRQA